MPYEDPSDEDAPVCSVPMFTLTSRPAQFASFNPRSEKHGDESVPAADLKLVCNVAADALDAFDRGLRPLLFHKANAVDDDLADQGSEAPNLRFGERLLPSLRWGAKLAGYRMQFHVGTTGDHDVEIEDCAVNKFEFSPKEGGTVVITFRVQCHPDEHQAGRLSMLIGQQVDVSLTPPATGGDVTNEGEEGEE